jgi:hypothetical protein
MNATAARLPSWPRDLGSGLRQTALRHGSSTWCHTTKSGRVHRSSESRIVEAIRDVLR